MGRVVVRSREKNCHVSGLLSLGADRKKGIEGETAAANLNLQARGEWGWGGGVGLAPAHPVSSIRSVSIRGGSASISFFGRGLACSRLSERILEQATVWP